MDKSKKMLRYLPLGMGIVLILAVVVGVYFLKDLFQKPVQTKKQVQQVTIIQPPPPPPPPPPEQKPPEPEVKEEKIPEPEPEPEAKQDEPEPQDAPLGVDAEGSGAGDGFGLQGKKGGREWKPGGGGGGNAIIWYGGQLSKGIEKELDRLLEAGKARESGYSVVLSVWVSGDGRVSRAELDSTSGKPDVDAEIKGALLKLAFSVQKPPPEDMPQPLKIRFSSRI